MSTPKKIQYITDDQGNKTSVVIPVERYEEILEDIEDLVAVAERKNEETTSFSDVVDKLKSDGLL